MDFLGFEYRILSKLAIPLNDIIVVANDYNDSQKRMEFYMKEKYFLLGRDCCDYMFTHQNRYKYDPVINIERLKELGCSPIEEEDKKKKKEKKEEESFEILECYYGDNPDLNRHM